MEHVPKGKTFVMWQLPPVLSIPLVRGSFLSSTQPRPWSTIRGQSKMLDMSYFMFPGGNPTYCYQSSNRAARRLCGGESPIKEAGYSLRRDHWECTDQLMLNVLRSHNCQRGCLPNHPTGKGPSTFQKAPQVFLFPPFFPLGVGVEGATCIWVLALKRDF